jgi:hexosaminidase
MDSSEIGRRHLLAAGLSVPVLVAGAPAARAAAPRTTPALLPAVQAFEPGGSALRLTPATRIAVHPSAAPELYDAAQLLSRELVAEGHLRWAPRIVTADEPAPHDIHLRLGQVAGTEHPEAYSVVADRSITITGRTADGLFWGTRTLVQQLRSGIPTGTVRDWPALGERALMLDIGRKYFSPDWIKALIREMSFLKMNTLQLHLSEGVGFRVECRSHPEIVSPQHLTREDVRGILDEAKRYHVEVNADVDTPGHLDHILSFHPELQLVLANGTRHRGHLDYSKPAARRLVHEIVDEMCDLFDGPVFHLGGDEFFPAPWQGTGPDVVSAASAPQLVEYARQVTGDPDATIFDGYEMYLNELGDLVRAKGKIARMWNDDIYPGEGVSRIDPRTQADVWIRWRSYKPTAGDYVDAGHDVINSNGDYLYFILTGGGVGTGPWKNPKGIYERWTPRTFMGVAGSAGDYILPADKPMLGSHLSVWCDDPSSLTQDQVADHLQEWLQVFAQQTWGSPKPTATLEELRTAVLEKVGTAPAG